MRLALLMILYKLMFGDDEPRPDQVVLTYRTTWKILFCLLLFFAADMGKVILTKIMAGHFHNQLHFLRMQDALNKVIQLLPSRASGALIIWSGLQHDGPVNLERRCSREVISMLSRPYRVLESCNPKSEEDGDNDTVMLQEYYLHALSGVKPHTEEGSSDVEAQRERLSIWRSPLLSHASLPSTTTLHSVPVAM